MSSHAVVLLSPRDDAQAAQLEQELARAGQPAHRIGVPSLPLLEGRLRRRGYEEGSSRRLAAEVVLRRESPELVHVFTPVEAGAVAGWCRRTARPAVFTLDEIATRAWLMSRRGRLRWVLAAAEAGVAIVVESPESADALGNSLGLAARVIARDLDPAQRAAAYLQLYSELQP